MPSRTITTTAEELIPENRLRKSLAVQNEDAAVDCFIAQEEPGNTTVSTTVHDHRLGAGGSLALNWENDGAKTIQGRWTIVAASGSPRISLFETEDIKR